MENTKQKYLVICVGGQGVRTANLIQSWGAPPYNQAVCDTDDRALACSKVEDRLLLSESSFLERLSRKARTVIVTDVLGGAKSSLEAAEPTRRRIGF